MLKIKYAFLIQHLCIYYAARPMFFSKLGLSQFLTAVTSKLKKLNSLANAHLFCVCSRPKIWKKWLNHIYVLQY